MWVQVSGMIGANSECSLILGVIEYVLKSKVYQPGDAPRYYKANTGLLVICVWMCVS